MGKKPCGPLQHHYFASSDAAGTPHAYTHIKLHMIPDGGISRFRVYGTVAPPRIGQGVGEDVVAGHAELNTLDLAAVLNGGRCVLCVSACDSLTAARAISTLASAQTCCCLAAARTWATAGRRSARARRATATGS